MNNFECFPFPRGKSAVCSSLSGIPRALSLTTLAILYALRTISPAVAATLHEKCLALQYKSLSFALLSEICVRFVGGEKKEKNFGGGRTRS